MIKVSDPHNYLQLVCGRRCRVRRRFLLAAINRKASDYNVKAWCNKHKIYEYLEV